MLLIPQKELDRVGGDPNDVPRWALIDTNDPEGRADLFFNFEEMISLEQAQANWESLHPTCRDEIYDGDPENISEEYRITSKPEGPMETQESELMIKPF